MNFIVVDRIATMIGYSMWHSAASAFRFYFDAWLKAQLSVAMAESLA